MGHWFSEKERGLTFSIWNTSHNVGGGVAGMIAAQAALHFGGWSFAFYVPGALALVGAAYVFWRLPDTPQSEGLPPIESYKATGNGAMENTAERDLTMRELLMDNVFKHKYIWLLAFANFFAYVTRYSMLDWGPMYLREMKGATITGGGMVVMAIEFGGIPSTILLGWVSDRLGGRRGMVATLSLIPILAAFTAMLFVPADRAWFDLAMLFTIGFFIYPVINLIVILALDLTSKKAIGTAAGFIGLFGYLGRMAQAKGFGEMLKYFKPLYGDATAWHLIIGAILASTVLAIALLAMTWHLGTHTKQASPASRQ